MSARRRRTGGLVAAALGVSLLLAGCSSHHTHRTAATVTPTPTTPAPVTTSAPAPKPAPKPVDPLTGGTVSKNPVVAVKIDDTAAGRPQRGIDQADLVYIEQVEGGLARLLAVFHTRLPVVEAVRSTRANDPELLGQYGAIGYVASGGGGNSLTVLKQSGLRASIDDWNGPGLFRDPNRPMPYNLEADLTAVARAVKAGPARSIGFTFPSAAAFLASTPSASHVSTYVGGTPVRFNYAPALKRYVRIVGGTPLVAADGAQVTTANVIVQYVRVTPDGTDVDVAGNTSMYTHSIGTGKVVVFRNGHRVDGSWSRPNIHAGTTLTNAKGQPIPLAPGGEYVLLVATGTPIT